MPFEDNSNTNLFGDTDSMSFDENKDYLSELVGEGKKFKDVNELAKGKAHADSYVETLLRQRDEIREDYMRMREENTSRAKLEDLIAELRNQPPTSRETTPNSNEVTTPAMKPEDLKSLVSTELKQYVQSEKETENFRKVQEKARERLGDNYQRVLKDQANNLGLSDDDVNQMARKNPNLFYKTFDLSEQRTGESFQTPPRNERRTDNFAPRSPEKRNWKWYMDKKAKGEINLLDPKIAVQMDKDAQALGTEFYA